MSEYIEFDYHKPNKILPVEKNCVAMAFSKMLGLPVYAVINMFIKNGWISTPESLQYSETIVNIMNKFGLSQKFEDKEWATIKDAIKLINGRYFAVNTQSASFSDRGSSGHAFCIIVKDLSLGISGNNADSAYSSYNSKILGHHKITIWEPVTVTPYYKK